VVVLGIAYSDTRAPDCKEDAVPCLIDAVAQVAAFVGETRATAFP
jgi:hypothetical protein